MSVVTAIFPVQKQHAAVYVQMREALIMRFGIAALLIMLIVTIAIPLAVLLLKSFQDSRGAFVGCVRK